MTHPLWILEDTLDDSATTSNYSNIRLCDYILK